MTHAFNFPKVVFSYLSDNKTRRLLELNILDTEPHSESCEMQVRPNIKIGLFDVGRRPDE